MADSPTQILDSIPRWLAENNAAALVGVREHANKQVRKAARKAIHKLRSRGVEIPDAAQARTWTQASEADLRGNIGGAAVIDISSVGGVTRLMLAEPTPGEGGYLLLSGVSGHDELIDFGAYVQTDGQRARLIRDWERTHGGRVVPTAWAKARLRWARAQTLARGRTPPRDLDDMLEVLGDEPSARPPSFLDADGHLADVTASDPQDNVVTLLQQANVGAWPVIVDIERILANVQREHPELNASTSEEDRTQAMLAGARGDEIIREALRGPVANLLDDAAIAVWLDGRDADAKGLLSMVAGLRTSDEPEVLPWVGRLYGMQVFAMIQEMARKQGLSTEAFASQLQQQAAELAGEDAEEVEDGSIVVSAEPVADASTSAST